MSHTPDQAVPSPWDMSPDLSRRFICCPGLECLQTRYPSFNGLVTVRGDWLGAVQGSIGAAPNVGCRQWFQLHVLADGKVAYCAIDSDGVRGTGDAKCQHVIHEIYRRPLGAKLRSEISSRLEVDVCRTCPMLT